MAVVVAGVANTNYYTLTTRQAISPTQLLLHLVSKLVGTATSTVLDRSSSYGCPLSYPAAVLAAHPIDYWRLNEGAGHESGNQVSLCNDYLGGNNGIYTNVTLAPTGLQCAGDPETSTEFGETIYPSMTAMPDCGITFPRRQTRPCASCGSVG